MDKFVFDVLTLNHTDGSLGGSPDRLEQQRYWVFQATVLRFIKAL